MWLFQNSRTEVAFFGCKFVLADRVDLASTAGGGSENKLAAISLNTKSAELGTSAITSLLTRCKQVSHVRCISREQHHCLADFKLIQESQEARVF